MDIIFHYLALLAVILLGLAVGLVVLVLQKVRKIRLATYTLLDDTAHTRRETEALFAQFRPC